MDSYEQNCSFFEKRYPFYKAFLEQTQDLSAWQTSESRDKKLNYGKKGHFIYSNYSIEKEIKNWLEPIEHLGREQLLVIYGLGLGYEFPHLEEKFLNLEEDKAVVYIEDDLEILQLFLQSPEAKKLILHPQVYIFLKNPESQLELFIQDSFQLFGDMVPYVLASPYKERSDTNKAQIVLAQTYSTSLMLRFIYSEFAGEISNPLMNNYHNIYRLNEAKVLPPLKGIFEGMPAIICGAGPSLSKQFPLLKQLKDKALIWAGGSAVNALSRNQIEPHFGGTVDPNPLQQERMRSQDAMMTSMFFSTRAHRDVLKFLHGERIYLPVDEGLYGVVRWIRNAFDIETLSISSGMTITQLLTNTAAYLGCDPIITIGMDLAYTGELSYAKGVVEKANMPSNTHNIIKQKDYLGNPISTKWEWVAEARKRSECISLYPDTHFINATEGGLKIEGAEHITLEETARRYLKKQVDIDGLRHRWTLESLKEGPEKEELKACLSKIKEELFELIPLIAQATQSFETVIKRLETGTKTLPLHSLRDIQQTHKKMQEKRAFSEILSPLSRMEFLRLTRHFNTLENWETPDKEISDKAMEKRFKLSLEELCFVKKSAQANHDILKEVLQEA